MANEKRVFVLQYQQNPGVWSDEQEEYNSIENAVDGAEDYTDVGPFRVVERVFTWSDTIVADEFRLAE